MSTHDVKKLLHANMVHSQFRAADAATLFDAPGSEGREIDARLDFFSGSGPENTNSEFWVVHCTEREEFLSALHTAARSAFRDYENQHNDFLIACEWYDANQQWAVVGVFNSFDAELEMSVKLTPRAYWHSAMPINNYYRQIVNDLKFNTTKTGFPTQTVVGILADMRFDRSVSATHFLLEQLEDAPGWSSIDDIPRTAIEEYLAHQQALVLNAAVGSTTHTTKRKI